MKSRQTVNSNEQANNILKKVHDIIKENKKPISIDLSKLEKTPYFVTKTDFTDIIIKYSKKQLLKS